VQGIDFATGDIDSLSTYLGAVLAGAVDLLFVELVPGEGVHWLRAPEDPVYLLDRPFLADLGERPLSQVADMLGWRARAASQLDAVARPCLRAAAVGPRPRPRRSSSP
jgi:hypothetical protein